MAVSVLLLALATLPAAAQDMGERVTFARSPVIRFSAAADPFSTGSTLYDSGASDAVTSAGPVVLFHGVSPDPGVGFYVGRQSQNGWLGWEAEVHRRPDGRFWARAVMPSGAGPVRLWAFDRGVRADHEVEIFSVELVEELGEKIELETSREPARPPVPDAPMPDFSPRSAWNARPATEAYTPHASVWRMTLHHSDGRYTASLAESLEETRFIQEFHQNGRRWIDIAYHYLIDEAGNIIEGRPESAQGAHALRNNQGNIGVVLLGKYHEAADHSPAVAQLDAVARLTRYLALRHGIDPLVEFHGHRDLRSTDCPGDHAYASLPELRRLADGQAASASPAPRARVTAPPRLPALARPVAWDGQRSASSSAAPNASR